MEKTNEVLIERSYDPDEKFIFIVNGEGKEGVISLPQEYHREIAWEYARRTGKTQTWEPQGDLEFQVLGGGRLIFNPEAKRMELYDCSGDFGYEPSRERTVEILQESHPDYEIEHYD